MDCTTDVGGQNVSVMMLISMLYRSALQYTEESLTHNQLLTLCLARNVTPFQSFQDNFFPVCLLAVTDRPL